MPTNSVVTDSSLSGVVVQIRRQEAIDKGTAQRRVYVETPDISNTSTFPLTY
jgi:hypothetical protein